MIEFLNVIEADARPLQMKSQVDFEKLFSAEEHSWNSFIEHAKGSLSCLVIDDTELASITQ